jgi:hypothetical protein
LGAVEVVATVGNPVLPAVVFCFSGGVADVGGAEVTLDVFAEVPDGVVEAVTEVAGIFADAPVVGEFTAATAAAEGQR